MFAFQMIGVPLALHAYLRTHLGSRFNCAVCSFLLLLCVIFLYLNHFESSSRPWCCCHPSFHRCCFLATAIPIPSHPKIRGPCCPGSQALAAADHGLHLVRRPAEHGGGDFPGAAEARPRPGGRLHQVPLPGKVLMVNEMGMVLSAGMIWADMGMMWKPTMKPMAEFLSTAHALIKPYENLTSKL